VIRLTFELYPSDGQIYSFENPYGYIFRGIIMKWLNDIKPEIVHKLHEYEVVRPYSINCIINRKIPKIDFVITSFQDDLSEVLINDLLTNEKNKIYISEKEYIISQIRFERINVRNIMKIAKPVKGFSIKFVTPAYFNTSKGDYPVRVPMPAVMINNLVNLWNSHADKKFNIDDKAFIAWVEAHMYISGYNLRSVKRTIGKEKPVVGGLGNATYSVSKMNTFFYAKAVKENGLEQSGEDVNQDYLNNCRWLEVLCRFGEYMNIGANRTAGMGVIRYYPKRYASSDDLLEVQG